MELKRVYINYGERDLNNCFLIFGSAKDIEKEYEQLERDGYTPFTTKALSLIMTKIMLFWLSKKIAMIRL